MRIVVDARAVQGVWDGLSNYVSHLVTALLRLDTDNEYVVLLHRGAPEALAASGLPDRAHLHRVVTSIPFMGPRQQVLLPLVTRRLGPAAVYHYPHFDLPVLAHPRSVVTVYDLNHVSFDGYFSSLPRLKRLYSYWTTWLTLRAARHIMTISNTTKSELVKRFRWVDPRRISVIYFGVNETFHTAPDPTQVAALRRRFGLGDDRFVLYVGTDRAHKNLGRLLDAVARLRQRATFVHKLLLVGSRREDDRLGRLIAERGLEGAVVRLGYLAEADLPAAYRLADAFAFCSLSEGFGMPLLEAMASDVPVVTSNFGAMAEVAGASAVLVDPFSVEAIAEGISRVLGSSTLRSELVARGRERVKNFTWEETARRTLEVYAGVTARSNVPDDSV